MSPYPLAIFSTVIFGATDSRFRPRWLPLLAFALLAPSPARAAPWDRDRDRDRNANDNYWWNPTPPSARPDEGLQPWSFPVFFPPNPPVLGSPLPLPNQLQLLTPAAPEDLAAYVNETFYASLGTRLALSDLGKRAQQKLNVYRAAKLKLGDELHAELAKLRTAGTPARKAAMEAFARTHADELAALEKTAEELRDELIRGELLQMSVDWDVVRVWRLGLARFGSAADAVTAQHQVIRAAAFYQKGLTPEHRGLLREITMEFEEVSSSGNGGENRNPPLFFSPPTARLRLPGGLPTVLAEKIARYESEKSALKQELREIVYAHDRDFLPGTRLHALEALVQRQAPQLQALETLAEEIREDLARLPEPIGPPAAPPIPALLAARLTACLAARHTLQSENHAKIERLKKEFSIRRAILDKQADGNDDLTFVIEPSRQAQEKMKAMQARLVVINQEIAAGEKALQTEERAIRRAFAESVAPTDGRSLESVMSDYLEALQQREEWAAYGDYQTAMLTPGLTPPLRRLLFDRGMANLELPLPSQDTTKIKPLE